MKTYKLKDIISQGTKDLFYIWWQELKAVVKDQGVLIFFILVPLGYPLLYTFIYTNETVREVPAAVVDNNRSSLSREYLRLVDAGADLEIVSHCSDMEEAKTLLKNGKVYGIIYIPESFSRDITKGVQTHVTIYCDMSGMLYYKAMLTANTNASLVMNKQIKIERSGNTTIRQDEVSTSPIAYEDISIFNPQNGFASFLIPAVLILIIQQTLLLGVGLSAGTARENNRFRDLIPMSRHYHGTLRIVLGKSLTYLMIYAVMATYMLCLVPKMFSLVQIAQAMEIGECVVARGTYLYATVSGFSSGRVKGNISSILVNDELVKVSLSLYDTDGMEGLYVPNSQFRETSKDVASGAMSGNMNMSMGSTGNSLAQWGMQAVNNAYQKTSNAISKAIKKNKVKLKYGTFVYLVNGQEKRN